MCCRLAHYSCIVLYSFLVAVQTWMNTSDPMFVGRQWLFIQLEDLFQKNNDVGGALLVGNPGSGKTAIMRQLVNSRNSSHFIHENIIAYHFCQFDNQTTRDGEMFVKSLVEQLSDKLKLAGFEKSIQNKGIQNKLDRCKDDLIGCAQEAVLKPLNALKMPPGTKKFILIDALNECRENERSYKSIIMKILQGQKIRLPSWIKLLVSSRNETTITTKILEIGVKTVAIDAKSKDNLDDIRSFAQEKISLCDFGNKSEDSMKEKLNECVENIFTKTDGNFLFIKMLLDDWEKNLDKINLTYIPANLSEWYRLSFRERFESNELNLFAKFFEVLFASSSPPTLELLQKILIFNGLMDDYVLDNVVDRLSAYLHFNNGIVRIFHQSFAEWLTSHNKPVDGFCIKKSRGHQHIANFLFDNYYQQENELTVKGLYELSMHVLNGGMLKKHVRELKGLNSTVIDEHGQCILHYLARSRESTDVLEVFIQQFESADIVDVLELIPAYYATTAGNYRNLKLLVESNITDVNYVPRVSGSCTMMTVVLLPHFVNGSSQSLIFIAALKGYTNIVELLINSGANLDKHFCGLRPLNAAVAGGHLKIVELLVKKTGRNFSNVVALHQAAFFNISDILKFLLDTGMRDKCIPCTVEHTAGSAKLNLNLISRRLNLFSDVSDLFCGSVLNTAVSDGNLNIVKMLLSYSKDMLECKSVAGLTPLMHAVERNNTMMVTLLLDKGADIEAQCAESNTDEMAIRRTLMELIVPSTYYCFCTSKAIHISVILGTLKITKQLMERSADRYSRDCNGWSADDLAAMHNQYINPSLVSNRTVMRYLTICGSVEMFEELCSAGVLTAVDEDGMTLLHLATLGLTNVFRPLCTMINCTTFKCPYMDVPPKLLSLFKEQYLRTIKFLTEETPQNINKKDKYGRTALHYAALVRSPDVVKHLIQEGCDWRIKDEDGNTALEYILKLPLYYINLGSCSTVFYSLLNSNEMAISSEMHVDCLIMLENLNTECKVKRTGLTSLIVEHLARHNLPLSWYILLKIDADLNCLFHVGSTQTSLYPEFRMVQSIATISELLKAFKPNVQVNHEVPFFYSVLHVMATSKPLDDFARNYIPSAVQRFVKSHSMGSRVFDERFDLEGYLPIHRAVLWENIYAIDWLMDNGVDIMKKTRSGWTTFHLALTNQKCSPRILDKLLVNIASNKEYNVSNFWCNTTSVPLSLLHIAAVNGLECLRYIHENTFIPISRLPFTSCNNTHGINLLYLMKLYHDVEWTMDWKDLGLPTNTTLSKYPEREAEYHLVYNNFFDTPHVDDLINRNYFLNLFQCPGINDLLPHKNVIEEQLSRCTSRCKLSASQASLSFSKTFNSTHIVNENFLRIVPQMTKFLYICIKMFYKISTKLWRQVSKACTCSHKCRCLEMMYFLQRNYTSEPLQFTTVGRFVAERMGWNNTSIDGDILYRWPFEFLLKKLLKMDKDYLKILSPIIET